MPPPTQRWMRPSATANVRIVSASSRSPLPRTVPSAPIDAPRPTGSSRAISSSAAIFGAPVTEPPGKVAASSSARPTSVAQRALDGGDEVRDARELALGHQLRPAHRARLADAREVVPLEVDDHHVLGLVLLALDVLAERTRALDRHRPDPAAAAARGRARARRTRSPSRRRRGTAQAAGTARAAAASARGSPANGAERCCTRLTW